MNIGFIGAGRVGVSLGHYFAVHKKHVTGYYSKTVSSACEAAKITSTRTYSQIEKIIQDSDVLFLTVPDREIEPVWKQIRTYPIRGKIVCHCSGAISSSVFSDIEETGAFGYSIHPILAISTRYTSCQELSNTSFTIEGSTERLETMYRFLKEIDLNVVKMQTKNKVCYHAATVMVSNFVITLMAEARDLFGECDLSDKEMQTALLTLMNSSVEAIKQQGIYEALTGPVERNDVFTVQQEVEALKTDKQELYRILSLRTVSLAREKYPDRDYTVLEKMLTRKDGEVKNEKQCCHIKTAKNRQKTDQYADML